MDALALLCTLHADGPTTLRRLRDAGCGSLEDLGHVSADRLAELLGVSAAAGRRFLREASSLAERIGRQGLEPEDDAAPAVSASASTPDRGILSPVPPTVARGLDRTDRKVLERVIDRWRAEEARDEAARSADPQPSATEIPESRLSPSERPTLEPAERPLEPAGRPLRPGSLDGLDARSCERLCAAGCSTIEGLAAASALELARRTALPFTLVRRLQFVAARHVAAMPEFPAAPIPARERTAELRSPSYASAPGPRDADDDGPAGPFA